MNTASTDMARGAVDVAHRKLAGGSANGKVLGPRLGMGGNYGGVFFWDTAFTSMWAKYHRDELPVERSLDNLYRLANGDGFIAREFSPEGVPVWPDWHPIAFAPPLLAWAELDFYEQGGGTADGLARLCRVYPLLKRHHEHCVRHFRREDGLFIGDPWGCGMDNLPRWPRDFRPGNDHLTISDESVHPSVRAWFLKGMKSRTESYWNQQGRYIDMSAQMAFDAANLARMAELTGDAAGVKAFAGEQKAIGAVINEQCWDEAEGFYFDLGYGKRIRRFHVGAYWTLLAGIVPANRLERFIAHLEDPARFGRPVPVPTLAADDPDYCPEGGYWKGSSWPPTTYMVVRGLRAAGAEAMARRIAARYLDAVRIVFGSTGTFWENLAPEMACPGNHAQPDFCGWAGLGPVAILRECGGES